MSCTRGTAVSLCMSQFLAMILVMMHVPAKRPLFVYTTSLSYLDALSSYRNSSYTMWFSHDDTRGTEAVNPYLGSLQDSRVAARHPRVVQHVMNDNSPFSRTRVTVVVTFALFMFPAFLTTVFSFSSVRLVDSGQISTDAAYGEHGVKDSLMWEVTFWVIVMIQHCVAQCVLSSPADLLYVTGTSFTVTILLLAFCVLAVNAQADSPSRRFEGPVFILISLVYLLIVCQSKVVLNTQFTFMMWFAHIASNVLLVMGHLWDNPVSCETIMNCRWTYVVMTSWFNIGLYIAY